MHLQSHSLSLCLLSVEITFSFSFDFCAAVPDYTFERPPFFQPALTTKRWREQIKITWLGLERATPSRGEIHSEMEQFMKKEEKETKKYIPGNPLCAP